MSTANRLCLENGHKPVATRREHFAIHRKGDAMDRAIVWVETLPRFNDVHSHVPTARWESLSPKDGIFDSNVREAIACRLAGDNSLTRLYSFERWNSRVDLPSLKERTCVT